ALPCRRHPAWRMVEADAGKLRGEAREPAGRVAVAPEHVAPARLPDVVGVHGVGRGDAGGAAASGAYGHAAAVERIDAHGRASPVVPAQAVTHGGAYVCGDGGGGGAGAGGVQAKKVGGEGLGEVGGGGGRGPGAGAGGGVGGGGRPVTARITSRAMGG